MLQGAASPLPKNNFVYLLTAPRDSLQCSARRETGGCYSGSFALWKSGS